MKLAPANPLFFWLPLIVLVGYFGYTAWEISNICAHYRPPLEFYQLEQDAILTEFYREKFERWPTSWEELREFRPMSAGFGEWRPELYGWFQKEDSAPVLVYWGEDGLPGGRGDSRDVINRTLIGEPPRRP